MHTYLEKGISVTSKIKENKLFHLFLKTNRSISVKHNYVILFRKTTTCFGLRDQHQAIITKILAVFD
jgi:hypothetical protein